MWKVLIVDDDFSTRKLMNRILHRRALVDHAINGREALEAYTLSVIHMEPYDAILLDVSMPEMDGLEVLTEIRRQEESARIPEEKRVPIIMITGRTETMMASFQLGCDDYLIKPVEPRMLLNKLRKFAEDESEAG